MRALECVEETDNTVHIKVDKESTACNFLIEKHWANVSHTITELDTDLYGRLCGACSLIYTDCLRDEKEFTHTTLPKRSFVPVPIPIHMYEVIQKQLETDNIFAAIYSDSVGEVVKQAVREFIIKERGS